jgi:hypothetical protein
MMIPAAIDSVGNPGIPIPPGGIVLEAVPEDDCVTATDVVLLTVIMFVVVEVTEETRKVVDDVTVETIVYPTVAIPAAGANHRIVDSGCDVAMLRGERGEPVLTGASWKGVWNPMSEPTIQPLLGDIM